MQIYLNQGRIADMVEQINEKNLSEVVSRRALLRRAVYISGIGLFSGGCLPNEVDRTSKLVGKKGLRTLIGVCGGAILGRLILPTVFEVADQRLLGLGSGNDDQRGNKRCAYFTGGAVGGFVGFISGG